MNVNKDKAKARRSMGSTAGGAAVEASVEPTDVAASDAADSNSGSSEAAAVSPEGAGLEGEEVAGRKRKRVLASELNPEKLKAFEDAEEQKGMVRHDNASPAQDMPSSVFPH